MAHSELVVIAGALWLTVAACGCGASVVIGGEDDDGARCEVPPPAPTASWDPIVHYPFDGDATNRGTLGTALDGITQGAVFTQGLLQGAIELPAPGFVALPGTAEVLSTSAALTIAFWFREPQGPALETPVFDCRSGDSGLQFYRGVYVDTMTSCWGYGSSAVGPGGCSSLSVEPGDWHHILLARADASAPLALWLDGVAVASVGTAGLNVFGLTTNDVLLGAGNVGEFNPKAAIRLDDLRVYDVILDDHCAEFGGPWCPCED